MTAETMTVTVTPDDVANLYRAAFDHVCDKTDWKAPINCAVPYALVLLYERAIEFMTGVRPSMEFLDDDVVRLVCCGYRLGPCGK